MEVRGDLSPFPFLDQGHFGGERAQLLLVDEEFLLRLNAFADLMLQAFVGPGQTGVNLPDLLDQSVELAAEDADFILAARERSRRHAAGIPDGDGPPGQPEKRPGDNDVHENHQDCQQDQPRHPR